jgi:hypothetical protein
MNLTSPYLNSLRSAGRTIHRVTRTRLLLLGTAVFAAAFIVDASDVTVTVTSDDHWGAFWLIAPALSNPTVTLRIMGAAIIVLGLIPLIRARSAKR